MRHVVNDRNDETAPTRILASAENRQHVCVGAVIARSRFKFSSAPMNAQVSARERRRLAEEDKKDGDARDGDPSGAQFVRKHVRPVGVVHRWIRDDGEFAEEIGARGHRREFVDELIRPLKFWDVDGLWWSGGGYRLWLVACGWWALRCEPVGAIIRRGGGA